MNVPAISAAAPRTGPQVSLRVKVLYGLGEAALLTKTVLFGLFTLFFYTTVMGLPGTLVGIATAIGLVFDAVVDPFIGRLSDRGRARSGRYGLGRRHSFMLAGALTMGASLWMFFSPPRGLPTAGLFAWLLVSGILVRGSTSLYSVPYLALGARMSRDYAERTSITAIRSALAVAGTLAAAGLSFLIFFPNSLPGDPKLNYASYPAMGFAFGIVMSTLALVAFAATLRWRESAPASGAIGGATADTLPAGEHRVRGLSTFQTRSFRPILFSVCLFYCAVTVNSAVSIHFLTYTAEVTASAALSSFQAAYYAGGLFGVLFWLGLTKRLAIEKRRLYLLGTVVTGVVALAAAFLVGEGRLLGIDNIRAIAIGHGLAGFFGSVLLFIPASMLADVADEDELAGGRRREGEFFGIFSFGQQLAAGVAVLAAGLLIDRFAGLAPGQAQQSALTIQRLGLIYGLVPAILLFLAAGAMTSRVLDRKAVEVIQEKLATRAELRSLRTAHSGTAGAGPGQVGAVTAHCGPAINEEVV